MYTEAKMRAYAKWHELLTDSEILMGAEERYDELLKLADDYRCRRVIDMSERNTLIQIATAAYTRSVASLSAWGTGFERCFWPIACLDRMSLPIAACYETQQTHSCHSRERQSPAS